MTLCNVRDTRYRRRAYINPSKCLTVSDRSMRKWRTSNLFWLWRCTIIVWALIWPYVAHSADGPNSLTMYVGVVETSEVCPTGYAESRCAVDRTSDQHRQLLDKLMNRDFEKYLLTSSQTVSELVLPKWMNDTLENVIEDDSEVSETHSAIFIFDLGHKFRSITFTIHFPDREPDVNRGEVTSIRRWYHHCQAGCIAPTNHVEWKVVANNISVVFKFVGQPTIEVLDHEEN